MALRNKLLLSILYGGKTPKELLCFEECKGLVEEFKEKDGIVTFFDLEDKTCKIAKELYKESFEIGVVTANNNGKKVKGTIGKTDMFDGLLPVLKERKSSSKEVTKKLCRNVCAAASLTAKDYMNKEFLFVFEKQTIFTALSIMNKYKLMRIIILNTKKQFTGLLSRRQIVAKLHQIWWSYDNKAAMPTVEIYKRWMDSLPNPRKKDYSDCHRNYSSSDIFKEMQKETLLGYKFKYNFGEMFANLLRRGKDISDIVAPPRSFFK